ncbi:MAG: class IV adenylate cyclase [Candidatus Diapherotrites archaeon]|nr:class IV adenylate cyclase [Candidatus Diapherotrites archaeon]
MASDHIEVEIKVPTSEIEWKRIQSDLSVRCGEPRVSAQSDAYYNSPARDFLAVTPVAEWLSIRHRGAHSTLQYKHCFFEPGPVFSYAEEFETEIGSRDATEKLLVSLGFRKLVTVEKKREAFVVNSEFEVALDAVTDLGFFVEVEALKDFGGVEKTREAVHDFAKLLGLDVSKADMGGYPWLLLQKKGLL